jgi:hypothetical protein
LRDFVGEYMRVNIMSIMKKKLSGQQRRGRLLSRKLRARFWVLARTSDGDTAVPVSAKDDRDTSWSPS